MEKEISYHAERRARLAARLRAHGIARAAIQAPQHVFYLTGLFLAFPGVRNRAALLLDAKGRARLVVSASAEPAAAGLGVERVPVGVCISRPRSERDRLFDRALAKAAGQSLGRLRAAEARLDPDIFRMRERKDPHEQGRLRALADLAARGYSAIRKQCRPGATELDLLLAAKAACVRAAGHALYVFGDFLSGPRTIEISGPPTPRRLRAGENVIVDLWLVHDGYWSDTARTFFVGGRPTAEQKATLEMLHETRDKAERAIRPGVKAVDIYRLMQQHLGRYGQTCPHHMGHGFGLESWEPPFVTADSRDRFEEGMAFTLEIGVYATERQACRIEDNYFVTAEGIERITGLR